MITKAAEIVSKAEIFIIVGTSMVVYPAAGLTGYLPKYTPVYYIDPHANEIYISNPLTVIKEKAGTGLPQLVEQLIQKD